MELIKNTLQNYEIDDNKYTEINQTDRKDNKNDPHENNPLYVTLFYYTNQNDLEVLIKNILGSKPVPLSNVELGLYVLGTANTAQPVISHKDTIGGKDMDEILYHELLHILNPEQDEAWVREQTLKAGYSRFQYPIANYS
ncbi:hypothetical protein HYV49_02965 [Candidatus Pacearchaeota archaeon]|nr:hypothetical protein [Candidatus Pacearchaeota archaeon]